MNSTNPQTDPSASPPSRRVLKSFAKDCARFAAGKAASILHRAFGARSRDPVAILLYHRCCPRVPGVSRPSMNVQPETFYAQLSGLQRLGYTPLPLNEVIERTRLGKTISPKTFVVTFDDGFESVYSGAWPVLRELRIPATIFIATAFVGQQGPFPFDYWARRNQERLPGEAYRPLSVPQCKEMMGNGLITLGAHTHTHADFRGKPGDLRRDMERCLSALQTDFGIERVPFAFPFGKTRLGYLDGGLLAAARATGVTCALTTDARTVGPSDDPFGWGRFNVYDSDSPEVLAAKCAGWFEWGSQVAAKVAFRRRRESAKSVFPSSREAAET